VIAMICIIFLRSAGFQKGFGHNYVPGPPPKIYAEPKPRKPRKPSGKRNRGNSRITEKDVVQIRAMAETMTNPEIAKVFGISTPAVQAIVSRRNWAHVK
jgi:hypothetical protein